MVNYKHVEKNLNCEAKIAVASAICKFDCIVKVDYLMFEIFWNDSVHIKYFTVEVDER